MTCIWCNETFTNKIALANHYDNVHKLTHYKAKFEYDETLNKLKAKWSKA